MEALRRLRTVARLLAHALLGGVLALPSWADEVNISYLDGQNPVAPDAIVAYGVDLFGDRVNLFNGGLEFEHTDLELPGNSRLRVALSRKHVPGQSPDIRGQFGDWDLEVPRIGGTFSGLYGWQTSMGGVNRCSAFSAPPTVTVAGGGGGGEGEYRMPKLPGATSNPSTIKSNQDQNATGQGSIAFIGTDYWRGTFLTVPGQGSFEVLKRHGTYASAPVDATTYPLVTHRNWQITCLPSIQNGVGEGFLAVAPDGTRYRFDWMAQRAQTTLKKGAGRLYRTDMYLLATLVADRFGNWVRYSFDPAEPALLTRIESSDDRVIAVVNVNRRAASATDGTRTITYGYDGSGTLNSVQHPDGSRWLFSLSGLLRPDLSTLGEHANCDSPGDFYSEPLTGTMVHPSGAVGRFTLAPRLFGRTFVDRVCNDVPFSKTVTTGAVWPKAVFSDALTNKEVSGPGLPTMQWSFAYDAPSGWSTCTSGLCLRETRIVTVTEPSGSVTRHTFGNRWRVNEGQLLRVDEGWNGSAALRTTTHRYRGSSGQAFPDQFGSSLLLNGDWLAVRHRPQDLKVITQQSTNFTWEVDNTAAGFDGFARPRLVRKYSSLGHSRTEATLYHDNTAKWVLGQLAQLTEQASGLVVERHEHDPATVLPTADYSFGKLQKSYAYNADGTLDRVFDAAGRATRLLQHKRGKPQLVQHPDGTSESQSINNLGNADWRTNGAGTTTSFQYDTMGRVSLITYPGGDPVAYHPTSQAFEQVGSDEYGLAAGHWRQTIATGNARRLRYFDALWRERLEVRYDVTNPGGTLSFEETRYDADGHTSFESYAERSFSTVNAARAGKTTQHDAIGRVSAVLADSELGVLQTITQYPGHVFLRFVTNPRGFTTTQSFQAFDTPSDEHITQIWAPEGVAVSIVRDLFGKALHITRGGNGASATRSYVYDEYQRLCKTVEPESAATVQAYDLAGNVAWRASGQPITSLAACDHGSVPDAAKISFGYDTRNRLTSTSYGDGSPWVSRSYTADGKPWTINTPHFGWTLAYNNRRLLVSEQLNNWEGSRTFVHGIDSHGHVASLSYPGGPTVAYSPDALGRPTQVSGYLSGAWHHPNGALGGYTAANGIVHSVSQNTRGLPLQWRHAGVVQDQYSYDANGNVTTIADQQEGLSSRTMAYDGLDRLTTANGIWGSGSYGYDTLDNLVASTVGSRSLSHNIDAATNRLASLSGSLNLGIAYDANGNITQRGNQGFGFDIGNRMAAAHGVASYTYDGLGRRSWAQGTGGRTTLRAYNEAGRLLLTQDSQKGTTWHIHLGDKVVAETNNLTGTRWLHTDALGSPVAATGAGGGVLERTRYEAYGGTAAGTNPEGIGFTGHVNDLETGLVYMQQRYYEPLAGRFLSVDPVTTDADTGGNFNRYAYVNGNPYAYTDPDGRFPWGALIGGGVELGAQVLQGKWSGDVTFAGAVNNLKDIGIAAAAGAITGGVSAFAAKQAISGAASVGGAIGKSALAGATTGAGNAVASDALQIGGKGITAETGAKAVIGALTGGTGAAVGGVVGNQASTALNALAGRGGVMNHIASTTAGTVRGTTTGATIGSSAGAAVASTGADVAATAVSKSLESKIAP